MCLCSCRWSGRRPPKHDRLSDLHSIVVDLLSMITETRKWITQFILAREIMLPRGVYKVDFTMALTANGVKVDCVAQAGLKQGIL